jgi:hypothetical protein
MNEGEIIYARGRWFRVLEVGEEVCAGDWFEWRREVQPLIDYQTRGIGRVHTADSVALFLRELDPLVAAMMGARRAK